MNLTGQPVYQKQPKRTKSNHPSAEELALWERIRALGCIICRQPPQIHHTGTGAGGRKNHKKVIGLCPLHHTGAYGIHTLGRKKWQEIFGTEDELMAKTDKLLASAG